jgi:hypothetical protein
MSADLRDQRLIRSLNELLGEESPDITGLMRAAKVVAGKPADIVSLLASYLTQRAHSGNNWDGAYWHPNGFAKFVIFDSASSPFRIRLHVWTGEDSQVLLQKDQNIHGHRWNFGSAVIAGPGLQVDEYVLSDTGIPYQSYEYRPQGDNADSAEPLVDGRDLEPVGEVRLERSITYALGTHDTYVCDITRLHTVQSASRDLTATLIIQGPSLLPFAPVYRESGLRPQPAANAMSQAQASRLLSAVIDGVSSAL